MPHPPVSSPRALVAALAVALTLVIALPAAAGTTSVDNAPKIAIEAVPDPSMETLVNLPSRTTIAYQVGIELPPFSVFEVKVSFINARLDDHLVTGGDLETGVPGAVVEIVGGGEAGDFSVTYRVQLGAAGIQQGSQLFMDTSGVILELMDDTLLRSPDAPLLVKVELFDAQGAPIDTAGNGPAALAQAARQFQPQIAERGFQQIDPNDPRHFLGDSPLVDRSPLVNLAWNTGLVTLQALPIDDLEDIGEVEITIYGNLDQVIGAEVPNLSGGREFWPTASGVISGRLFQGGLAALEQGLFLSVAGLAPLTSRKLYLSIAFLPRFGQIRIVLDDPVTQWPDFNHILDADFETGDTSQWAFATAP